MTSRSRYYRSAAALTIGLFASACDHIPWAARTADQEPTKVRAIPVVTSDLPATSPMPDAARLPKGGTATLTHATLTSPAPSSAAALPAAASARPSPIGTGLADPNPLPAIEFDTQDPTRSLALRFQPLDTVKVQIWGYPELDHLAEVQPNGTITLPLVGELQAAGLTVEELRLAITERLTPFSNSSATQLRPGDTIIMDVWQHEDLRATSVIDPEGLVTFPLAGRVMAAGRDLEDIRHEVEQRLLQYLSDSRVSLLPTYNNRRVLYDPHVSVLAQKLEPRRVALIGEVGSPGLAEIRGSLRVVEALAQARVLEKTAKMNSIVVIRESARGPQFKTVRIADYLAGEAPDQNIYLQHKDIVIVPKTFITKVGDFVDQFVSKTAPVFAWWLALNQSRVAIDSAETVKLINESLERQLLELNISP